MTIYSHDTALSLLRVCCDRLVQDGPERFSRPPTNKLEAIPGTVVHQGYPNQQEIDYVRSLTGNQDTQVHVQVLRKYRINRPKVTCHTIIPQQIPKNYLHLSNALYIPPVEEVLFQICQSTTFIQALKYAYELCGCYSLPAHDQHRQNLQKVSPFVLPSQVIEHVAQKPRTHGKRAVLEVMKFVLPFSASPMETVLVIILVLPRRLGGYGLPSPHLNFPINYRHTNGAESRFFLDLFWPEFNLAIEYDSDEHHFVNLEAAYHDADRRLVLRKMGIETIVVTKGQMMQLPMLDNVAEAAMKKMGKRVRPATPELLERRRSLHEALLPIAYRYVP